MSAETSAASTFWASTRTSSGSTRLTSISLVVAGNGLLLRGVPGVFGRETSRLVVLRAGEPGTGLSGFERASRRWVRDSDDSDALNFLIDDMGPLGVVDRGSSECCDTDDSGRLGVNGMVRVGLGVGSGAMVVVQIKNRTLQREVVM